MKNRKGIKLKMIKKVKTWWNNRPKYHYGVRGNGYNNIDDAVTALNAKTMCPRCLNDDLEFVRLGVLNYRYKCEKCDEEFHEDCLISFSNGQIVYSCPFPLPSEDVLQKHFKGKELDICDGYIVAIDGYPRKRFKKTYPEKQVDVRVV